MRGVAIALAIVAVLGVVAAFLFLRRPAAASFGGGGTSNREPSRAEKATDMINAIGNLAQGAGSLATAIGTGDGESQEDRG